MSKTDEMAEIIESLENDEQQMKNRSTWGDLYDLYGRKDGPIKEALTSLVRTNGSHIVGVTARPKDGEDKVKVQVGYLNRPTCDDPFGTSSVGQVQKTNTSDVEEFEVSLNEAKDFFGTEVVKVAKNFKKAINRNFRNSDI